MDLRRDLPTRRIEIDVTAKDLVTPAWTFATARAGVTGTAAEHAATLALKGEDLDVTASAHGGFDLPRDSFAEMTMAALAWKGSLDALDNRGSRTLKLAAPATVEIARTRVRVGAARLAVADGNVRLAEFAGTTGKSRPRATSPLCRSSPWHGSRAQRCRFVPPSRSAANGRLPRRRAFPVRWRCAAKAAISSSSGARLRIRRSPRVSFPSRWPRGSDDDALDATASLRSTRGDKADAKLAIGAVAGAAPGHIAPEAPLEFAVSGDIPSLQFLQPWIGSAAVVSGRLHVDVAARGTVARPALSGAVVGEGLRIDAPQYGLHYTNGRLAARAAERSHRDRGHHPRLGDGTFHASGEISGLAPGGAKPLAKLTWKAEKFRAFNRPDLRLVVGGEGSAVAENGRITLVRQARADEGSIVYLATPDSTLGDDVVVKGWTRPTTDRLRFEDLPLAVDLTLDLGERLMFSGEGIETRLAGCRACHDRSERSQRQGLDPHGARHLLRVRPAARRSNAVSSYSTDASTIRASTSWRCASISRSRRE